MRPLLITGVIWMLLTTGCASILNPYDDEFQCPDGDFGKCTSMEHAYEESLSLQGPAGKPDTACNGACAEDDPGKSVAVGAADRFLSMEQKARIEYQVTKYDRLKEQMDRTGEARLVAPEKIRMWIDGYTDSENNYMGQRFVYFYTEQPQWSFETFNDTERYGD